MNPDFDKGYLTALKRMQAEIQAYSDLITDVDDMTDEEVSVANRVCYDIMDLIRGEITNLEEF